MTSFFRWLDPPAPRVSEQPAAAQACNLGTGLRAPSQPKPAAQSPQEHVESLIKVLCAEPVTLVWTNNRRTMLSYRRGPTGVVLRLHRAFSAAQVEQVRAIARYLAGDRGHTKILSSFAAQAMAAAEPRARKKLSATAGDGQVHRLGPIFSQLNQTYFHGSLKAAVSWGRTSSRRARRRSIQLGCYVVEDNLIRIHPALDQDFVPPFVVEGVMYHEMLHEALGVRAHGGRRLVHPPEFVALERSHPNYERCAAWEAQNLRRLLSYAGRASS